MLTKIAQDVLELSQHHGAILVLVIELAELNEIVVVARVLGLLDGFIHEFDDLIKCAELLASVVGLTKFDGDLLGNVHAEGIEDVHKIVHVKFASAIPIVDFADLSGLSFVLFIEKKILTVFEI